jgi:putative ABC transport system permease protein
MTDTSLRVVWYRFWATVRSRWPGYLALVVLIGALGGLAMGAIVAARRTQSSFATFLASTNPSDVVVGSSLLNPALGPGSGYDTALIHRIAGLPGVRAASSVGGFDAIPLNLRPAQSAAVQNAAVQTEGSIDGLYLHQNRVTVLQGRLPNLDRADEFVTDAATARVLGLHVGEVIPWGFYSDAQVGLSNNLPTTPPYLQVNERLVGTVVFNNAVIQDEVDATNTPLTSLFTPALTRQLTHCCLTFTFTGLQLVHGSRDVSAVEAEVGRVIPPGLPRDFTSTATIAGKANRALKPESIALGVFGAIAALAALLIAGQLIGRQLRLGADETRTLRALGADPTMTMGDGLLGTLLAVAVGTLVAVGVAVALSPLAPLGAVRPVYPARGVALDGTVLAGGAAVLMLGLGVVAAALALRQAPHRVSSRDEPAGGRTSRVASSAASAGLPPPAVAGIRLALEPGSSGTAVPVRSAMLGAVLAMVVVTATLTFGASLSTLAARPALYGWNWSYLLSGGQGVGTIPPQAHALLAGDRTVAATSDLYFATLEIDGQTVPALGSTPRAPVAPPLLSGHAFNAANQVVLGATTLADVHRHVGDVVEVRVGDAPPTRLRIVGTATMPTIGAAGASQHTTMGTGALLSYQLIPPTVRNSFQNSPDGPNAIFVRLRDGADPTTARRALDRIATALGLPTNYGVTVVPVQRPAEIVNYQSMGTTPIILGAGLGVGAFVALGLTLMASVRRRRQELALLKTLGFTRRQLAATVAWQSSVAVVVGAAVGAPIGVALGRALWILFADDIHAVARPSVPLLTITALAVGAILLANLVAAVPGRVAARTPTATLLRAE